MSHSTKLKRKTHAGIIGSGGRCIYCSASAPPQKLTVEHMPPLGLFRRKDRPRGFEFTSCKLCNEGTKAADAAVAFFSRIHQHDGDSNDWRVQDSVKYLKSANDGAPGFIAELFSTGKSSFLRTRNGILIPVAEMHTGPIGQALLNVFAAKLGMALYRQHVGEPLPLEGGVHGMWFLNSGLSEETAMTMLSILPSANTIKMGVKSASGQFDYRFNSDDRSVVAALTRLHGNVHIFTIAMAEPALFRFPMGWKFGAFVRTGELMKFMPSRPSVILAAPYQGMSHFRP